MLQRSVILAQERHPSVGWGQYLYGSQCNSTGPSLR